MDRKIALLCGVCLALVTLIQAAFAVAYLTGPAKLEGPNYCAWQTCRPGEIGIVLDDRCICATPVYDLSRHGLVR